MFLLPALADRFELIETEENMARCEISELKCSNHTIYMCFLSRYSPQSQREDVLYYSAVWIRLILNPKKRAV